MFSLDNVLALTCKAHIANVHDTYGACTDLDCLGLRRRLRALFVGLGGQHTAAAAVEAVNSFKIIMDSAKGLSAHNQQ
ncbi:MAG: hypothetical protein SF187_12965 [Deltaproteobacteria bacterium]|nr:hypothetical protein [Deltaproteobacteria bacterium]